MLSVLCNYLLTPLANASTHAFHTMEYPARLSHRTPVRIVRIFMLLRRQCPPSALSSRCSVAPLALIFTRIAPDVLSFNSSHQLRALVHCFLLLRHRLYDRHFRIPLSAIFLLLQPAALQAPIESAPELHCMQ